MKTLRRGLACLALIFILLAPAAWAQSSGQSAPAAPAEGAVTQSDLPAPPPAAAPAPVPAAPKPGSALGSSSLPASIVDMGLYLGAFVLVLVILYFSLKGLSRLGRFRGGRGRSVFELRGLQALDSRNYLAAVEIDGRMLVVGVSQDRISPLAHWYIDEEEGGLDFTGARLPADEPALDLKLPEEDEDPPLDISIADSQKGPKR